MHFRIKAYVLLFLFILPVSVNASFQQKVFSFSEYTERKSFCIVGKMNQTSRVLAPPVLMVTDIFCDVWKAVKVIGAFLYMLFVLVAAVIMFVGDLVTIFQFTLYEYYGPLFLSGWANFLASLDFKC